MYKIKLTILVISVFMIYGCKPSQQQIIINQIPCNESILLMKHPVKNEINDMVIYYDFEVYKTCLSKIEIVPMQHYHGYSVLSDGGRIQYILENNRIYKFDYSNPMFQIYYRKPRTYRIETWQPIDSNAYMEGKEFRLKSYSYSEQKEFLKPYLDSMNKLHLDTLRIGSIAEVQRTNPKFFDYFIKGDSIFIEFFNPRKGIITKFIPIEIK